MAFNAGDIEATLKLDRTPFTRDLEAATRQGKSFDGTVFKAILDTDRKRFTKGLDQAKASGDKFSATEYKAKLGVDRTNLARELRSAQADVDRLSKSTAKIKSEFDTSGMDRGLRNAEGKARASGITVANQFSSPLRTIQWTAIFAGITAAVSAAPTALVGLGASATALVGAFKAPIGAISAFNDAQKAIAAGSADAGEKVALFQAKMAKLTPEGRAFVSTFTGMREELASFGQNMQSEVLPGFTSLLVGVETLVPTVERGSTAIGRSISQIAANAGAIAQSTKFQNDLNSAFANSVPIVSSAGNAIVNLGRDIVTYAARSREQALGTAQMVDELSSGFTRFFQNLLPYQAQVGTLFSNLGGLVGDFVAEMGTLTGEISSGLGPALGTVRQMLQQFYTVLNQIVSGAMPGMSAAFSGAAITVQALLSALAPFAPFLGGMIGQIAPFVAALKIIDLISFGNVKGQFTALKTAVSDADGVAGKAKAGFMGLASLAFSPAGLAAGALGIALMELGKRQQQAQQAAQEHKTTVQGLTQALISDKGAVGAQTQAYIAQTLAQKDADKNARALGISYGQVQAAASGNVGELNNLNAAYDSQIAALLRSKGATDDQIRSAQVQAQRMLETGAAADDLTQAYREGEGGAVQLTAAEENRLKALINLKAATDGTASATAAAVQAARQQAAAEQGVTTSVLDHYNALVKLNAELLGAVDKDLAYRTALTSLEQAHKAAADAAKGHAAGSIEVTQANQAEEQAVLGVIQAAGEKAKAQSTATGEDVKAAEAARAMNAEAVRLAGTYQGALPRALESFVAGMSRSDAAAAGLTEGVNAAGEAVYRLPNGKEVKIAANTQDAIDGLNRFKTEADALEATAKLGVDINPATGGVLDWKNTTSTVQGNTTTYTNTDPATGQVHTWRVTTDATGAKTTTYTTTDPATGAVTTWKRNTDGTWALSHTDTETGSAFQKMYAFVRTTNGTWAWVPVDANTSAAQSALRTLVNTKWTTTVYVTTVDPSGAMHRTKSTAQAIGHIVTPMANGGVWDAAYMASGGSAIKPLLNPGLAQYVPPGTERVVGDRGDVKELYAPLDGSNRTKQLITAAAVDQRLTVPEMVRYMADGGLVQASDGSWVDSSQYSKTMAPKRTAQPDMLAHQGSTFDYAKLATLFSTMIADQLESVFADGLGVYIDQNSAEKGRIVLNRRRAAR